MMSQPGKQTIAMDILPYISRSTGNQTMKCNQLIESNMRNIFLEKSYIKYGGETFPRPFSEKSKLSISRMNSLLYSLFLLYAKLGTIKQQIKQQTTCFQLIQCFFKKPKEIWFHCLVAFTLGDIGQYGHCNCFLTKL